MIKDFLTAIGNFKKYGVLAERGGFRTAGYSLLLLLVCSIGLIIVPTFTMGARTLAVIWEDIPAFTLTRDGLTVEKDFDIELGGVKFFATNNRQVTDDDFDEDILSGVLMDGDSVIIRNFSKTMEFSYGDFDIDFTVTKNDLPAIKPVLVMSGALVCIMLFVSRCITFALNGLFIGSFAGIVSIFMKLRVPTGKLIKLGLYSQTLPCVISAVLGLFGVFGESIFLYAVSLVFIVLWFISLKKAGEEQINPDNGTEN